jgi:hypothetical protein
LFTPGQEMSMNLLDGLKASTGSWRGTSTLQDPHAGVADKSSSTATVSLDPDGVRLDYTWSYRGKPQEGSILFGLSGTVVTARWTDTWHTGNEPMVCSGPKPDGPTLSVRGTYAAPPGPDWGWRIDVSAGGETLRVVMHNIWPQEQGGKEELAVEAVYARA